MNVGPLRVMLFSTNTPPNQSTMTIITVPRNSLIGWAICWRVFTRRMFSRYSEFILSKRRFIFSSAQKAFMMRSPPSVSSTWLIVSLHSDCAFIDFCFSLRPTKPMNQPMMGTMTSVKSVSCQLMTSSVAK